MSLEDACYQCHEPDLKGMHTCGKENATLGPPYAMEKKASQAKDHLGRSLSAEEVCQAFAAILGWGRSTPYHVLEKDMAAKMKRIKYLEDEVHRLNVMVVR